MSPRAFGHESKAVDVRRGQTGADPSEGAASVVALVDAVDLDSRPQVIRVVRIDEETGHAGVANPGALRDHLRPGAGPGRAFVLRNEDAGRAGADYDPAGAQGDTPDALAILRREGLLPGVGTVPADVHAFVAAEVERAAVGRIDDQRADVALDEHAVGGAEERRPVIETAEDALADRADVEPMRRHEPALDAAPMRQGKSSNAEYPAGSCASSGSMQGMPSRTGNCNRQRWHTSPSAVWSRRVLEGSSGQRSRSSN